MKKKLLFALTALLCAVSSGYAFDLPDEDLTYVVLYKWGLINKDAMATWIIKVELSDPEELAGLLDEEAYSAMIN